MHISNALQHMKRLKDATDALRQFNVASGKSHSELDIEHTSIKAVYNKLIVKIMLNCLQQDRYIHFITSSQHNIVRILSQRKQTRERNKSFPSWKRRIMFYMVIYLEETTDPRNTFT